MTYIPQDRWSAEDLAAGCGYAIVTKPQAEDWTMAPAVAGGWIAVNAPINYVAGVREDIVAALDPTPLYDAGGFSARRHETARCLEDWTDSRPTIFLAALPAAMMRDRKMPLSAAELESAAAVIEAAFARLDAVDHR